MFEHAIFFRVAVVVHLEKLVDEKGLPECEDTDISMLGKKHTTDPPLLVARSIFVVEHEPSEEPITS